MEVSTEWSWLQVFSRSIDRPTLVHNGTHDTQPSPRNSPLHRAAPPAWPPAGAFARSDFNPSPLSPAPSFDGKQVFLSVKVGLPHDRRNCLDCQREVTTILGDIVAISNVKPAARSLRLRRGRLILSLVLCDEERNDENLIPRWMLGITRSLSFLFCKKIQHFWL